VTLTLRRLASIERSNGDELLTADGERDISAPFSSRRSSAASAITAEIAETQAG
jgi:hypothetical protein